MLNPLQTLAQMFTQAAQAQPTATPWQTNAQFAQTCSVIMQQRTHFLQQQAANAATLCTKLSTATTMPDAVHAWATFNGQMFTQLCTLTADIQAQRQTLAKMWQPTASAQTSTAPTPTQTTTPPATKAPAPTAQPAQATTTTTQPTSKTGKLAAPNTKMVQDVPTFMKGTFIPATGTAIAAATAPKAEPALQVITNPDAPAVRQSGNTTHHAAHASPMANTRRSVIASRSARSARARVR